MTLGAEFIIKFKSGAKEALNESGLSEKVKLCLNECLLARTLVTTSNSMKAIEDINIGNRILSINIETGEISYKSVISVIRYYVIRRIYD